MLGNVGGLSILQRMHIGLQVVIMLDMTLRQVGNFLRRAHDETGSNSLCEYQSSDAKIFFSDGQYIAYWK